MALEKNRNDNALSPVLAEILLTALTVLLIAIFLAILMGMIPQMYEIPKAEEEKIPEIIKIMDVTDVKEGIVKLEHVGKEKIRNSEHSAQVYIDAYKKYVVINTLQGGEFIPTNHFGIKNLYGAGPTNYFWEPGDQGVFNLKNKIIRHNCTLRIDIIRNSDGRIISTSEFFVT